VSSTRTSDALPLAPLLSRPVLISGAALTLGTVLAWIWLSSNAMPAHDMSPNAAGMSGMSATVQPWSGDYLLAAFTMWVLMMVAMMLPSAAPMILLHGRIDRGTVSQRARDTYLFVACYLTVWVLFSAAATVAQAAMIDGRVLTSGHLVVRDKYLAAGLLLAAGLWQLTRAKAACLEQCQSPLQFVLRYWKPGPVGAVRLGIRHGLFCLGCCWSLMLVLFVGGVMNLAWIAGLALVVFIEKIAPPAWRADRWLAGLLISAAVATVLI
jgi:predicted metal-binding membrane protein